MKKNGMGFILTFLVTGIFCACDDATTPEPVIPPVECVIPSETKTIKCTKTPEIVELEPNVKNVSVHFSGAVSPSEKEIYLTEQTRLKRHLMVSTRAPSSRPLPM